MENEFQGVSASGGDKEPLLAALKQIEGLIDNQNPTHEEIWRIAYGAITGAGASAQPKEPHCFRISGYEYACEIQCDECKKREQQPKEECDEQNPCNSGNILDCHDNGCAKVRKGEPKEEQPTKEQRLRNIQKQIEVACKTVNLHVPWTAEGKKKLQNVVELVVLANMDHWINEGIESVHPSSVEISDEVERLKTENEALKMKLQQAKIEF